MSEHSTSTGKDDNKCPTCYSVVNLREYWENKFSINVKKYELEEQLRMQDEYTTFRHSVLTTTDVEKIVRDKNNSQTFSIKGMTCNNMNDYLKQLKSENILPINVDKSRLVSYGSNECIAYISFNIDKFKKSTD